MIKVKMKEKDKNNDRLVVVKLTPKIEQEVLLLIPKGVEINQEILENSSFNEGWWDEETIVVYGSDFNVNPKSNLEIKSNIEVRESFTSVDDLDLPLPSNLLILEEDGCIGTQGYHTNRGYTNRKGKGNG